MDVVVQVNFGALTCFQKKSAFDKKTHGHSETLVLKSNNV